MCRPGDCNELDLGIKIVRECFAERGDSILSVIGDDSAVSSEATEQITSFLAS